MIHHGPRIPCVALLAALGLALAVTACGDASHEGGAATAEHAAPQAAAHGDAYDIAEIDADSEALLARADALDGSSDHVVAYCPGCGLAMEGSADYPMHAGDYEMHFCSDSCRDRFAAHGAESIAALEVPDAEGGETTP